MKNDSPTWILEAWILFNKYGSNVARIAPYPVMQNMKPKICKHMEGF